MPKAEIVWFKKDLRSEDHLALWEASKHGKLLCIFIYEASLYENLPYTQSHRNFLAECLLDLDIQLQKLGGRLIVKKAEALDGFNELLQKFEIKRIWSHEETGDLKTYQRDLRIQQWCRQNNIQWIELPQNGVVRRLKNRDGWSKEWYRRMHKIKPLEAPTIASIDCSTLQSIHPLELASSNETMPLRQKGGTTQAKSSLESFLTERGRHYNKQMSSPITASTTCSRISPHLSFGSLSMRQVATATKNMQEIFQVDKPPPGWKTSLSAFSARLRWHCHFMQKLEDQPSIQWENMNRAFDDMRVDFDESLFEAWKQAQTGYPMIDACMRALKEWGWINFRMRAMLASFSSYHLWLPWQKPADYLASLFLDYEPGIHYSQFQMQSGTTGINSIRIYSPIKQQEDQDPEGKFIRHWLPELEGIPDEYLSQPHLLPTDIQRQLNFKPGRDYPLPVVDHKEAYNFARKTAFAWKAKKEVKEQAQQVYEKHGSRKRPPSKRKI